MNKEIEHFLDKLDEDQLCLLCLYKDDCSGSIRSDSSGSPIYPPCSDGTYDCMDEELIGNFINKAKENFIMYDDNYEKYLENEEEIHNAAVDTVLNQMSNKKEDKTLLNISISKEWVLASVKQIVKKYANTQIQEVKNEAVESIKNDLIENKLDVIIEEELRKSIKEKTDAIMDNFMDRTIRVPTGYWNDEYEEKPIKQYIEEKVEKWIEKDSKNSLQKFTNNIIDYHIEDVIENFGVNLKKDLYKKIDDMFNQTTRNALSESMFSLLTSSETYRNLKSNINNLLEDK